MGHIGKAGGIPNVRGRPGGSAIPFNLADGGAERHAAGHSSKENRMAIFVAQRWVRVFLLLLTLGLAVVLVPSQALQAQGQNQHVVRTGDTLSSIAAYYGTTVGAIVSLNGLAAQHYIHVGQILRIPSGSNGSAGGSGCAVTHVIQAGENLLAIARRHGISTEALASANGIANVDQ